MGVSSRRNCRVEEEFLGRHFHRVEEGVGTPRSAEAPRRGAENVPVGSGVELTLNGSLRELVDIVVFLL